MTHFSSIINHWYKKNKRDLPWRKTKDPYKIWISEIILQQTQISQGLNYYHRFIEQFPTVEFLASSPEDEVLKLWQGLGYYSRARNLHFTAKIIVNSYNSEFPTNYGQVLKLKGIGPYTAAAITSMAYGLPYPAVDGNVYRLLSRYFGIDIPIDSAIGKKHFSELAEQLLNTKDPGTHNQAMMEFGALQCIPVNPQCHLCPLIDSCSAFADKNIKTLPVKSKKTKQANRYFYYLLIEEGNSIYIQKRTNNDIWKNLYELPLIETPSYNSSKQLISGEEFQSFFRGADFNINNISKPLTHILSHQKITARLIYVHIKTKIKFPSPLMKVNKKDIHKFAVPRLIEKFFQELEWYNG